MLGIVKIQIVCDACHKEKVEIEAEPLLKEEGHTKIVVFADQLPTGWTELVIKQDLKYICDFCMKGVPNSGYAF